MFGAINNTNHIKYPNNSHACTHNRYKALEGAVIYLRQTIAQMNEVKPVIKY